MNCGADITILEILQGEPRDDYRKVITYLGQLGNRAVVGVPYLIRCLLSDDKTARFDAAMLLADVGPGAIAARSVLIPLLQDEDNAVRLAAARALYSIDVAEAD